MIAKCADAFPRLALRTACPYLHLYFATVCKILVQHFKLAYVFSV